MGQTRTLSSAGSASNANRSGRARITLGGRVLVPPKGRGVRSFLPQQCAKHGAQRDDGPRVARERSEWRGERSARAKRVAGPEASEAPAGREGLLGTEGPLRAGYCGQRRRRETHRWRSAGWVDVVMRCRVTAASPTFVARRHRSSVALVGSAPALKRAGVRHSRAAPIQRHATLPSLATFRVRTAKLARGDHDSGGRVFLREQGQAPTWRTTLLIDSGERAGYSWRAFAIEGIRGKLAQATSIRLDSP
jgi:hypothetical protein